MSDSIAPPPSKIRALRNEGILELQWGDGPLHRIPFKTIRNACPCAGCIDEFTGRKILDPHRIPDDIQPTDMSFTGNYALKISWSDGHSSGLYTWDRLARIVCAPDTNQAGTNQAGTK